MTTAIAHALAQALNGFPHVRNARPVHVALQMEFSTPIKFVGALYEQNRSDNATDRQEWTPRICGLLNWHSIQQKCRRAHKRSNAICWRLCVDEEEFHFQADPRDWYVAGYGPEIITPQRAAEWPFGHSVFFAPWESADGHKIDTHEKLRYYRFEMRVRDINGVTHET